MAARNRTTTMVWGIATILLVVAAAGILAGKGIMDNKDAQARKSIRLIRSALEKYRRDHGRYPAEYESLDALVDPSPQSRYLVNRNAITDPWGGKYVYSPENATRSPVLVVYSTGPNGIDEHGRGDDVVVRE